MTYAADRLYEEAAYVAYHFHWALDDILDLEHPVRNRFVDEIGRINRRLSKRELSGALALAARRSTPAPRSRLRRRRLRRSASAPPVGGPTCRHWPGCSTRSRPRSPARSFRDGLAALTATGAVPRSRWAMRSAPTPRPGLVSGLATPAPRRCNAGRPAT